MRDNHLRLVKQEMPQTQTHNGPYNGPDGDFVKQFLGEFLGFENLLKRKIGQQKAGGQQDAVPSDLYRTQMESNGIDFPSNCA